MRPAPSFLIPGSFYSIYSSSQDYIGEKSSLYPSGFLFFFFSSSSCFTSHLLGAVNSPARPTSPSHSHHQLARPLPSPRRDNHSARDSVKERNIKIQSKRQERKRSTWRLHTPSRPTCASRSTPRGARTSRVSLRPTTPTQPAAATSLAPRRLRSDPWTATAATLLRPRRQARRPCRASRQARAGRASEGGRAHSRLDPRRLREGMLPLST